MVRTLGDVSPVASALARQQFDNHVKRVRVFLPEALRDKLAVDMPLPRWSEFMGEAIDSVEAELV